VAVGNLMAIRRFPVKSLAGESLSATVIDDRGLVGDRLWAVLDAEGKLGSGKNTRRMRRIDGLLRMQASYDGSAALVPRVRLADGGEARADDPSVPELLSSAVGTRVTLARETTVSHYDDGPVSIVTTAALRALGRVHGTPVDPRRFRANLLVDWPGDDWVEDDWIGRTVAVGEVRLRVDKPLQRCVMVDMAQAPMSELPDDGTVLKTLGVHHGLDFAVLAHVEHGGTVRLGDSLTVLPEG
jgi:uncharacterized protein